MQWLFIHTTSSPNGILVTGDYVLHWLVRRLAIVDFLVPLDGSNTCLLSSEMFSLS